jgi:peptidoglycan hydrolase-like protein with peptidoglycan-binding domain
MQITQAQIQLKNKGLYSNAIDGIIGPETIKALKVYQESIGIPVTGKLDETTKKAMEIH